MRKNKKKNKGYWLDRKVTIPIVTEDGEVDGPLTIRYNDWLLNSTTMSVIVGFLWLASYHIQFLQFAVGCLTGIWLCMWGVVLYCWLLRKRRKLTTPPPYKERSGKQV
jgi:hypothetical protein